MEDGGWRIEKREIGERGGVSPLVGSSVIDAQRSKQEPRTKHGDGRRTDGRRNTMEQELTEITENGKTDDRTGGTTKDAKDTKAITSR
jgi:hypothetical protein